MIKLTGKEPDKYTGDMVVFFVRQEKEGAPLCGNGSVQKMVARAFAAGDFSGREGQTLLYYPAAGDLVAAKRVLVVGLGPDKLSRETFRLAGGTVSAVAVKTRAARLMVAVSTFPDFSQEEAVECLAEGLVLGSYQFRKYKKTAGGKPDAGDEDPGRITEILMAVSRSASAKDGAARGMAAAFAGCAARDMANEPGNVWTPASFAEHGRKLAKQYGLNCRVLAKTEMKKLGMGGIIGVNSGSAQPPKMVVIEYLAGAGKPTLLLVGKGLTFDAGGISLKPGQGMEKMKYDMCGGAAVMAAMQVVGAERPKNLNVVAMVPATENLPGPAALKPGDIISQYGGKTVEVVNTDAEGRLILADALAYGIKKFKPAAVIDLATLTGSVVIGLGHHRTGLLANNDDLADKIMRAGDRSGEPFWRLPLGPEYSRQIKSDVADIKNVGDRSAGTITAAAFLQEFVGDTPWAHLDIAGTAYEFTEKSYIPKGPSGIGVRTLVDLIRNW